MADHVPDAVPRRIRVLVVDDLVQRDVLDPDKQFVRLAADDPSDDDAAVQLICRLGRRLPPAPLRMLDALTTYLEACGGTINLPKIGNGA